MLPDQSQRSSRSTDMEYLDMREALESIEIIVDSREQPSSQAKKRYKAFGCPYRRQTMSYGDYTYNFRLNGKELIDQSETVYADCIIERKASLEELSSNLTHGRARFMREFTKARENGASIYLLIENSDLKSIYAGHYNTHFDKKAYFASFIAFLARYHIQPVFCPAELSGRVIYEILYRELKERLEKGLYDGFSL